MRVSMRTVFFIPDDRDNRCWLSLKRTVAFTTTSDPAPVDIPFVQACPQTLTPLHLFEAVDECEDSKSMRHLSACAAFERFAGLCLSQTTARFNMC